MDQNIWDDAGWLGGNESNFVISCGKHREQKKGENLCWSGHLQSILRNTGCVMKRLLVEVFLNVGLLDE